MKNNKIKKILFSLITIVTILSTNNVCAKSFNAKLGYDSKPFGSEVMFDLNSQGKGYNHGHTYEAHLTNNGTQYVAYCIDPVKPAAGGLEYSCTNKFPKSKKGEDPRPAYAYVLNYFIEKNWTDNHRVIQSLTVRFLAEHYGINDSKNNAGYAKSISTYVDYIDKAIAAEEKYNKCVADNEKVAKKNDKCTAQKQEIKKLEKQIDEIDGQIIDQNRILESCLANETNAESCEGINNKIRSLEDEKENQEDKLSDLEKSYDNKCGSKGKTKDCSSYNKTKNENNKKAKNTLWDSKGWVTTATKIYKAALKEVSDNSDDESNFKGKISYKLDEKTIKTDGDNYQVTYNVTSSEKVAKNDIKFVCENCEIVNSTWDDNGKSGKVTIKAVAPKDTSKYDCNYKIQAQYIDDNDGPCKQADIYYCSHSKGKQYYVTSTCKIKRGTGSVDFSNGEKTYSDIKDGSITGMIPSGNGFHKKYCENPDVKHCNEKTNIETPTICDDATDRQIKITGPSKQITKCVLHGKDDADNSYQDTKAISASNKYCSVFCKEDYELTMPGAQYSNSGRYFNLKNTVVKAKRTCYSAGKTGDAINIENYINDIIDAQEESINAYDEYLKAQATASAPETSSANSNGEVSYHKDSVSYQSVDLNSCDSRTGVCTTKTVTRETESYNWSNGNEPNWDKMLNDAQSKLSSATSKMASITNDMKACYNWNNELCLDPKIDFDYNETYKGDIKYDQVEGTKKITQDPATYKAGKGIDEAYNANSSANLETINYLRCDSNGCRTDYEVKDISTLRSALYYRKVVTNGEVQYNNRTGFQTNYPTGVITTTDVNNPNLKHNYSYLGAVFPVALKTDKGVYNWTLKIREIGQYNDSSSCKSGRLNKVAEKINKKLYSDLGYGCVYIVNCPDCPIDCECPSDLPDGYTCIKEKNGKDSVCSIKKKDETCPDCEVECTNCIFNFKDNFAYRTVGLQDINPNDRTIGANWTDEKGKVTKEAIESKAEEAYLDENIQYSYQVDANSMKKIRDMNKQTGTYAAADLDYHDLDGVKNAYGISSFLEEGQAKGYFKEIKRNTTWNLWPADQVYDGIGRAWK